MALREPTLSGATIVTQGLLYAVNGTTVIAPTTQSVSAWAASIPTEAQLKMRGNCWHHLATRAGLWLL
jgi:hypothetical protein